jgi:hypothetical protein
MLCTITAMSNTTRQELEYSGSSQSSHTRVYHLITMLAGRGRQSQRKAQFINMYGYENKHEPPNKQHQHQTNQTAIALPSPHDPIVN